MSCGCGCGRCAGPIGQLPPGLRFLAGSPSRVTIRRIGGRLYIGDDTTDGSDASSSDTSSSSDSSDTSDTSSGDMVSNTEDQIGNLQIGQGVTPNDIKDSITSGAGAVSSDAADLSQQVQDGNYSGLVSNGVLDAQKLAGAAVNTYSKAQTVAATLNGASSSQPDFTGQKTQQAQLELAAAFTAVATVIGGAWGAAMGAAFTALLKSVGAAHAGYGTCLHPPANSDWPTIKAWQFYTSFAMHYGGYSQTFPAGSFEAWANPILQYNFELGLNCFGGETLDNGTKLPGLMKSPPQLLALLVVSWNQLHTGPMRAITRVAPACDLGQQDPPGYIGDPISQAMPFQWDSARGCPTGQLAIHVNNGPPVRQIKLHLAPVPKPLSPQQLASALAGGAVKTGTTSPGTVAAVAGVGALAGGAYLVHAAGGIAPALSMLRRLVR